MILSFFNNKWDRLRKEQDMDRFPDLHVVLGLTLFLITWIHCRYQRKNTGYHTLMLTVIQDTSVKGFKEA